MKREDKTMDLKGRHFLTLKDFTPEEIIYLLDLAAELKEKEEKRDTCRSSQREKCGADL